MAQPWEKAQKAVKSAQKPWEKYQKPHVSEQKSAETPQGDTLEEANAALQGFGQGATLNYMPQLQAGLEVPANMIGEVVRGDGTLLENLKKGWEDSGDYATRRDAWAKTLEQLQARNPKASLGGQLAGGLTTALAVPGATLAKGASIGAKTAATVGTGLAYRGLSNPGETAGEVSPLQIGERADAMFDPLAVGIDAAVPGAGKLATKVAETKAFKALGPYARESMKAMGAGKVQEIGREVLDSNAFGWLPKSYESLHKRLTERAGKAGQQLGETVETMARNEKGVPISLNREEIAQNMEKNLISPEIDAAGVLDRNARMQAHLEQWRKGGLPEGVESSAFNDNIPLLEAELKKRGVNKEINWDRLPGADIPDTEVFNRELSKQLRSGVEDKGVELAQKTGFDVNAFKNQKSTYGNLSNAEEIVAKREAKEFANRMISPSDYGTGMLGAAIGYSQGGSPEERMKHALMGAGLGVVNNAGRKYGNQMMSRMANRTGQILDVGARNPIAQQAITNPSVWQTLFNKKQENEK